MAGRSFGSAENTATSLFGLPSTGLRISGTGVCSASRGIAWVNFCAPNSGLRGVPVGTLLSAKALGANGLRPFFSASAPVAVKMPHL